MSKDKYLKTVAAAVGLAAIVFGFDDETTQAVVGILTTAAVFFFPK